MIHVRSLRELASSPLSTTLLLLCALALPSRQAGAAGAGAASGWTRLGALPAEAVAQLGQVQGARLLAAGDQLILLVDRAQARGGQSWLFRSEDGGRSWTLASRKPKASAALVTAKGSHLLGGALIGEEIGRSPDGGQSWHTVRGLYPGGASAVATMGDKMLLAQGRRLLSSEDDGRSWTIIPNMAPSTVKRLLPIDGQVCVAAPAAGLGFGWMLRCPDDDGRGWVDVTMAEDVWLLGDKVGRVRAGRIEVSSDRGAGWSVGPQLPLSAQRVFFGRGERLCVGSPEGLLISHDGGASWSQQPLGAQTGRGVARAWTLTDRQVVAFFDSGDFWALALPEPVKTEPSKAAEASGAAGSDPAAVPAAGAGAQAAGGEGAAPAAAGAGGQAAGGEGAAPAAAGAGAQAADAPAAAGAGAQAAGGEGAAPATTGAGGQAADAPAATGAGGQKPSASQSVP